MKKIIATLILSCVFSVISSAMEFRGVTMPDKEKVEGKDLVLNGMGLRDLSVMGVTIRVYVAGLYLEKKTSSEDEVIKPKGVKYLKMQFLRKISASDMKKSWQKGVEENCADSCDEAKKKLEELKNILPDVKSDEVVAYTFNDDTLKLEHNGKALGSVKSAALVQAVLGTWVGKKPVTGDLKAGLLATK
jgi:hypothetical protein